MCYVVGLVTILVGSTIFISFEAVFSIRNLKKDIFILLFMFVFMGIGRTSSSMNAYWIRISLAIGIKLTHH